MRKDSQQKGPLQTELLFWEFLTSQAISFQFIHMIFLKHIVLHL